MSNMKYTQLLSKVEELSGEALEEVTATARDWALTHGLVIRSKQNFDENSVMPAPFTLLPSPVDEKSFHKAIHVQKALNLLFHRIAYDFDFLKNALTKTIQHDEFTRRLFEILETVHQENYPQPLSLGLLRSDYLPDANGNFKQVEMNTIASSMAGLTTQVDAFHRFMLPKLGCDNLLAQCPKNNVLFDLSRGLIDAWGAYGKQNAVIMFLTEEVSINIADQRFIEFEILSQRPKLKVLRKSFLQLLKSHTRLGRAGEFLVDDDEVAVLYFRTGYDPEQYLNEECWSLRLLMERSKAIKCPSIQYHLAGAKKVQQVLSEPGVIEKYLSKEESALVREMFVDFYPLDQSQKGEEGYQLALSDPSSFVLKPQREGGGNNIYGSDIPPFLKSISREEASSYILMRLINPIPNRNIIFRPGANYLTETVSELGVYGVICGDGDNVRWNVVAGHALRTKEAASNETGVVAGFGALDSPILV